MFWLVAGAPGVLAWYCTSSPVICINASSREARFRLSSLSGTPVEYFGGKLQNEANRMADMVNELISLSKLQGAEALLSANFYVARTIGIRRYYQR